MRIRRPDYDVPARCPGWAGGGWRRPTFAVCDGGLINWDIRFWAVRPRRCATCRTIVLPWAVHLVDPTWWAWELRRTWLERRHG